MPATTDVTFTLGTATTSTGVAVIPGSVTYGGNHDIRGGRVTPVVVAGNARDGSLQCIIDTNNPETTILALQSAAGAGNYLVQGTKLSATQDSYNALVDVSLGEGEDGVEVATISWKGTVATA